MTNLSRPFRGRASVPALRSFALALLLSSYAIGSAHARPSDALHAYAGVGYFHDDNLFRLSDAARLSDSARYAIYGVYFDKTYGRQKIYLQAKFSDVRFSRFEQLDYHGKDLLGRWNWELGRHFEGAVGGKYEETLAPYVDFRSQERNLRVHKRQHADGIWKMHPSYRLRVGLARDTYTYELPVQRFNNRREDLAELGVDHIARSGSSIGLVLRRIDGRYDNARFIGGIQQNDDFEQDELKAKIHWKLSGISSIELLAGHARRRHQQLGPRDADGFNGRLTASLNPRKKLRVNAALWREFAPIESNLVSYSLNRGASVGATWDAQAKLRLEAYLSRERRSYDGRLIPGAPGSIKDTLSQASLNASWSLRPTVQLNVAYTHQRRSGADYLGNGSFKSNVFSVNANAQF